MTFKIGDKVQYVGGQHGYDPNYNPGREIYPDAIGVVIANNQNYINFTDFRRLMYRVQWANGSNSYTEQDLVLVHPKTLASKKSLLKINL